MAKGDHRRVQDQIRTQQGIAQNNMNRVNNQLGQTAGEVGGYYTEGAGRNIADYDTIMRGYQNIAGPGGGGSGGGGSLFNEAASGYRDIAGGGRDFKFDPEFRGAVSDAIGGYRDFSKTGGFSEDDIQNIRARNIAPTRSVFSSAQQGLNQQRSLAGFSPNYTASTAKLARDLATTIGDMNVNTNAGIAEMVQQGKLAGLGGLSSTGIGAQGVQNDINSTNAQMWLAALGGLQNVGSAKAGAGAMGTANQLGALRGMTDLYGTNPGLAQTFGNQLLGANQQLLGGQDLQNQLSLGTMNAQLGSSQVPGNFASAMGNVNAALSPISNIAGAFAGLGGFRQPNMQAPQPYGSFAPSDRMY